MVRALEERVGVSLFNRTTRSVSLTEAGAKLFERVRPAVEELAEALGETRERRANPAGTVRIHCFPGAADLHLTPILRAFSDAYPQIVLDITLDDAVVNIVAEGYDVAIRLGEVIDKDLIAVKLGPELRQTAVASPDYLARHGTPAHPRDLLAHRCIGWQLIAPHIAKGRLVPLLEAWSAPFPGYYLCYPAQRQMAPSLRAVIDAIRGGLRATNAGGAAVGTGTAAMTVARAAGTTAPE